MKKEVMNPDNVKTMVPTAEPDRDGRRGQRTSSISYRESRGSMPTR